jgi:hypothetical protein
MMKPIAPTTKRNMARRWAGLERSSRHLSGMAAWVIIQRRWAHAPKNTKERPVIRKPGATM